jgi:peptidoglycan hydrolase-like amidase
MAIASMAASAAGGAMSTVGSYYSALGQKSALRFQATLAEINAKASESDARNALARGERAEQSVRLDTANLKSTQRVALASNGVDLGSDTAAAILTSTDVLGEIDANQTKANALREAWGHRTEAVSHRAQATIDRATASGISPGMNAFSTLLTSAGQVAGQYYQAEKSGSIAKSKERWGKIGDKAGSFLKGLKGF